MSQDIPEQKRPAVRSEQSIEDRPKTEPSRASSSSTPKSTSDQRESRERRRKLSRKSSKSRGPRTYSKEKVEPATTTRKKPHRRSSIFGDLADLEDEIVPRESIAQLKSTQSLVTGRPDSPPDDINHVHKMYIQTARGYKYVDRDPEELTTSRDGSNSRQDDEYKTLVCAVQRAWFNISTICHGLLGGFSLSHLVVIWTTNPNDFPLDSLTKFDTFADVFNNTFYFLAIICMVSVFDRMDLSTFRFRRSRSLLWTVLLVVYAVTILLTLSSDTIDERLYFIVGDFNITVTEQEIKLNKVFNIWNRLSVGRSVGGLFGWLVLGLTRPQDHALYNLQ